jgi:hypothetical protein
MTGFFDYWLRRLECLDSGSALPVFVGRSADGVMRIVVDSRLWINCAELFPVGSLQRAEIKQ